MSIYKPLKKDTKMEDLVCDICGDWADIMLIDRTLLCDDCYKDYLEEAE